MMMGQTTDPAASEREQRLERVIAAYLESVEAGKPIDAVKLLAQQPDLADELRQFFDDHERMMHVANSSQAMGPSGGVHQNDSTSLGIAGSTPAGRDVAAVSQRGEGLGRFGDYELVEEIARGGMGVVYKARQASLARTVAIKMILRGSLAGKEDVERFTLEARAVAKLNHPHIVVIYDVGQCGEQYYYSMEFVEGRTLAELARGGPLNCRKAAEYVEQIARAMDYAHQNGVVHRDIKPSNVLIDGSGRARVTDFGLAKHGDRGDELTLSGQILGTPAYMAPEQITNRRGEIGPACDIYGIGALFYELLTGQPPFKGRDQFDTLLQVLDCTPQSLRRHNPHVPHALEMICLKCLEKDPLRRYGSATEIADDIARYLAGDSISHSGPNLLDRMVRTLERSQFDREFHTWSRMLVHLAWISLATHVLVFLNRQLALSHPLANLVGIRALEIGGMAALLWVMRSQWFPPRGAPVRQMLSLWSAYVIGSLALMVIAYCLPAAGTPFNDFAVYPPMAVLASLLFIMLGSSYWGYSYIIGGVFLALAFLMVFWLALAPLLFGAVWAASLTVLSVRLGYLAENR